MFLGSLFHWMFPRTLDEQLQDLYDDMGWGKYQNPNEGFKMNNDNWIVIDDTMVRHRWECPDCDSVDYVQPWYYSESGGLCCDNCDCDMEYIQTEINDA